MAAGKLLNLIAISTLAILAASFGATSVSAVSVDTTHLGARGHAHAALAKKRRSNNTKRCKPRPSSNTTPATKPTPTPTSVKVSTETTVKASASASKTPTPSPSPAPSTGGGNSSGASKVGLGWANDDDKALTNFANAGKIGFTYNWSPYVPPIVKKLGIRGCAMLWGDKQVDQFKNSVKAGYSDCAMGFNEPNQNGQSDMAPEHAAQLWIQYIEPLRALGYTLISPAPTNAPSGKTWLQAWLKACNGKCNPDAIAVHYYGTQAQPMKDFLIDMHTTFNKPIWVTEFACQNFGGGAQCNEGQVWDFMTSMKTWMDGQSWVHAYFAFGALYNMGNVNALNQLLGGNGFPTKLGYYYIGA